MPGVLLFSDHADPLLDMGGLFKLIHHCDSVIRIRDDALAFAVQRQLFAAEDIFSAISAPLF